MACQKSLDFAAPPGTDAHLSYYWTMDEAGDLDKVDSAAGYSWNTNTGTSSPAGLFVNGIQIDSVIDVIPPFYHGIQNIDDTGLSFDATTSKGVSIWFWIKKTIDPVAPPPVSGLSIFYRCRDVTFVNSASMELILSYGSTIPASPNANLQHHDITAGNDYEILFDFNPAVGSWHMFALTMDLVAHTLNLYIDGVLAGTAPDAGLWYTGTLGTLSIGSNTGGGRTLEAVVDEFGLSLKGALTAAQVLALYNAGSGMTWPTVTTVVPYP